MPAADGDKPPRAIAILGVLILGAVVANLNLGIANVALPSIGAALQTTQAQLNLVAVALALGLAASVLYLGALADRYGRKRGRGRLRLRFEMANGSCQHCWSARAARGRRNERPFARKCRHDVLGVLDRRAARPPHPSPDQG